MKNNLFMINEFILDLVESETHTFESDVTDYPVESGGSFTDNIRPKPLKIQVDGIVTDTPIFQNYLQRLRKPGTAETVGNQFVAFGSSLGSALGGALGLPSSPGFVNPASSIQRLTGAAPLSNEPAAAPVTQLRSEEAYAYLYGLWQARDTFPLTTSLGRFEDMALVSLTIPRSKDTGEVLKFTASFQQVQKVTNNQLKTSDGKNKKGTRPGKPVFSSKLVKWNRYTRVHGSTSVQTAKIELAKPYPSLLGYESYIEKIIDTLYVEYRYLDNGKFELWFPEVQPISIAAVASTTGYTPPNRTTPIPTYASTNGKASSFENRKLKPEEQTRFFEDLTIDSYFYRSRNTVKERRRKEQLAINHQTHTVISKPPSDFARQPKSDPSKVVRDAKISPPETSSPFGAFDKL